MLLLNQIFLITVCLVVLSSCSLTNKNECNLGGAYIDFDPVEKYITLSDKESRSIVLMGDGPTQLYLGHDTVTLWSDKKGVVKLMWASGERFLLLDSDADGVWDSKIIGHK